MWGTFAIPLITASALITHPLHINSLLVPARSRCVRAAAPAGGFGDVVNPAKQLTQWDKSYKQFVKQAGQVMCVTAWNGYERLGRGAVFANYDDRDKSAATSSLTNGVKVAFVSLEELEKRPALSARETTDIEQVLSRVKNYKPQQEFVVCFQAYGLMGADIVKPSIPPPEVPEPEGWTSNAPMQGMGV